MQRPLPPVIRDRLLDYNLSSCSHVLSLSPLELCERADLTLNAALEILTAVATTVVPPKRTVLDLYRQSKPFFSTSIPALDAALNGGLPTACLTELVGPPGSGKSQFCLLLSLLCTLPENGNGSVVYFDTEGAFSASRLREIAANRFPSLSLQHDMSWLNRIQIFRVEKCEDLLTHLQGLESFVIQKKIKCIIVDSIASLVRKEFNSSAFLQRNDLLMKEATILKYLAETFSIPVIVTNQVTTARNAQEESVLQAALGNTWSHSVNTRLIIEYKNTSSNGAKEEGPSLPTSATSWSRRRIIIAKSPVAPSSAVDVAITISGFV